MLPIFRGYRRWHTAFNKIVTPMDLPGKGKRNVSVLKQLLALRNRLLRTVCLLLLRQSSSRKTRCGSTSPAWSTATPTTALMEPSENSQDRSTFTQDIRISSLICVFIECLLLFQHEAHKLLYGDALSRSHRYMHRRWYPGPSQGRVSWIPETTTHLYLLGQASTICLPPGSIRISAPRARLGKDPIRIDPDRSTKQ
jgi:hypothetical protein